MKITKYIEQIIGYKKDSLNGKDNKKPKKNFDIQHAEVSHRSYFAYFVRLRYIGFFTWMTTLPLALPVSTY
jgi:hypothetical protein